MNEGKMRFESPDLTQANIDQLCELFPSVVTEKKDEVGNLKRAIDFDALKELLGEEVAGPEAYEFTWVGKKEAIREAGRPTSKTLRPCPEESKDWDTTENLYIEGDNLEVLKLLQESYLGKIKMIYIDPPYNTGNDLIYKDDYKQSQAEYDEDSGAVDEEGGRLVLNNDSNGRFHSDWCSMMYPRLVLARNLLSNDGAIFLSIDDNEVAQLRKICDEVFSSENFVNQISVKMKNIAGASGGGEDKRLKKNIEYLLVYSKDYQSFEPFIGAYVYTPISELVEQYREEGISWKYTSALVNPGKKVYVGSTVDGEGSEIKIFKRVDYNIKSISSLMKDEKLSELEVYNQFAACIFQTAMPQSSIRPRVMKKVQAIGIESDLYSVEYIPRSGRNKGVIYEQFYKGENFRLFAWLSDVTEEVDGVLCKKDLQGTFWDYVGQTKNLTKEGGMPFPNGKKPVAMIKQIISMQSNSDSIIVDFFSGSASTAHAVIEKNAEDNGNRKFIMVQIAEPIKENDAAYNFGCRNVADIGKERILRAGEKIKEEAGLTGEDLDIGFRALKLVNSNMNDVYFKPNEYDQNQLKSLEGNIKGDRTDLDLLYACLLDWGLQLSLPHTHEEIDGVRIHTYNEGDLIACFAENVSESVIRKIASRKPIRAVFRDGSFKDSPSKINVFEIFKLLSPDTTIKVV